MNPYPAYRHSDVEWLGEVPEHWGMSRVTDVFEARSGGTPSTAEDIYWKGDIPWVSAKDMKALRIADTEDHISEEAVSESATSLVPKGAVLLVARSGILKHTLPVGIAECEVAINQDIKGLIPDPTFVDALYFVYWTHGLQSALLTLWRQQGATVESLDFDSVRSTAFPLPPLHEQHAIAAFLDRETERIDALVAKERLLIERLQEHRTALITHTVTRGLPPDAARAAGLDPSPRLQPSGVEWLGDVPEHWEAKRLNLVASINDDTLSEREDPLRPIAYVDIGSIDSTIGITEMEEMVFEDAPSRARRLVRDGDTIVATVRTYLRAIAPVASPPPEMVVSTGFAVIRPRALDPGFASWTLREQGIVGEIVARSTGVSYPAINASQIGDLPIAIPPLDEQCAIAAFLDRETERIDALVAKKRLLIERLQYLETQYRTALITVAVTGKVDVRELVAVDGS